MRRCILISSRTGKDKETNDQLLFLTFAKLPNLTSQGNLWHPKSSEILVNACINKNKKPDDFEKFAKILPGSLFDVTIGINEYNEKPFVADIAFVEGSDVFDEKILFV